SQRDQQRTPAELDVALWEEAREQRVPGDGGGDRVDALVESRRDQLDASPVAGAGHADPGVARRVELRLRLLRDPVHQPLDVAALVRGIVDLDGPARLAEAPGVPGEDVVAVADEVADPWYSEDRAGPAEGAGAGVAARAPAGPLQDRRRLLPGP